MAAPNPVNQGPALILKRALYRLFAWKDGNKRTAEVTIRVR